MSSQPDFAVSPEPELDGPVAPTAALADTAANDTEALAEPAATDTAASAGPSGPQVVVALQDDDTLQIDLAGVLDDDTGRQLLDILNRSVVDGVRRVAIDLRHVDDVTEEGALALAECRSLGRRFSDGLHYRSDSGPGRVALMAALADLSADDDLA